MVDMFPGIPIFPALGNHESAPVNRYTLYLYYTLPTDVIISKYRL